MSTKTKRTTSVNLKTQKLVFTGLFSAISFVLYLLEFPIIPSLNYLKLDFSDIPALIGAIFFGPSCGVIIELIKNVIELLVKGIGTQMGFGNIMNFLIGCGYVVPFSIIFSNLSKRENFKHWKSILIASITSIAFIIVIGIAGNYIIAPLFFKYFLGVELSKSVLWTAIWGATAINAIKGAMLSIVIYPLMKLLTNKMSSIFKI